MAGTQFCLEWDAHNRNICNGLSSLQQNGEFVDMTLAADGHHVKVHQMVLALASPYIKELITSANCPHPVIFLNKVSYKTLCFILEYIYTGQTQVAVDDITELITAAKELHIKGLEDVKSTAGVPSKTHMCSDTLLNLEKPPVEVPEVQLKIKLPDMSVPISTNAKTLKRKLDVGNFKKIASNMPLRKRMILNKPNTYTTEGDKDMPDLTKDEDSDTSKSFGFDDPLEVDDRDDDLDNDNQEDYSVAAQKPPTDNTQKNCVQFTVSNQGSLQLIVNRFIYYCRYTYRNGARRWNCLDSRHHGINNCPARLITTPDNFVDRRVGAHNHPFHDRSILKRVRAGAVYSALKEVEAKVTKNLKASEPAPKRSS